MTAEVPYRFRLAYCGEENLQHVQDALSRCAKDNEALVRAGQNIRVVNSQISWKDKIKYPELFNTQMNFTYDFRPMSDFL